MNVALVAVGITLLIVLAAVSIIGIRRRALPNTDSRHMGQRRAVFNKILESQGRCAVGQVASQAEHDLNNLLLVLSMEAARLSALGTDTEVLEPVVATLNRVVGEGRQISDALAEHTKAGTGPSDTCDIVSECHRIADFLHYLSKTGLRVESTVTGTQSSTLCTQPAEIRLLIFELCCLAIDFVPEEGDGAVILVEPRGAPGQVTLTVSCQSGVVDATNTRLSVIKSLTDRVSGDFQADSDNSERCLISISIPVAAGRGA